MTHILRTSLSSSLMRFTLFKGICLAVMGLCGLLWGALTMPPSLLQRWGPWLFLIGMGFITWGMLPYRRLSLLQVKPDELHLASTHLVNFYRKGKKILTLSLPSIEQLDYVDEGHLYGIALKMRPHSLTCHEDDPAEMKKLEKQGKSLKEGELFFPYFSRQAFRELQEWQQEAIKDHFE